MHARLFLYVHFDRRCRKQIASFLRQHERIAIIGLGNEYRTDDGAGIATIRLLEESHTRKAGKIALFDVDRNLMRHFPKIEEFQPSGILLIDAANLGMEPGGVRLLDANQVAEQRLSTHENNLDLVMVSVTLALPRCRVLFLGIQFKSLEMSEGLALTEEVKEAVASLAGLISNALVASQS